MSYGIKVSLPGYDVKSATPEQCAVHTDYPAPLIRATAAHFGLTSYTFGSDPADGTHTLLTIPHGYTYTPNSMVFMNDNRYGTLSMLPFLIAEYLDLPPPLGDGLLHQQWLVTYADATNLVVEYRANNNGVFGHVNMNGLTFDFKHYIFTSDGSTFP